MWASVRKKIPTTVQRSSVELTKGASDEVRKYMGMDVHQAITVAAVLDADGKVILETMVPTEPAAIIRLVQSLSSPLHVTLEETLRSSAVDSERRRVEGEDHPSRWTTATVEVPSLTLSPLARPGKAVAPQGSNRTVVGIQRPSCFSVSEDHRTW